MIRYCLDEGGIPPNLNYELVVLIPKKPQPKNIGDCMSFSLLRGIYKIMGKMMANKIKNVGLHLVDKAQLCFVKGRSMIDSMLLIWAGLDHTPKNMKFMMLKVKFENDHDIIVWSFILECLKAMNFWSLV